MRRSPAGPDESPGSHEPSARGLPRRAATAAVLLGLAALLGAPSCPAGKRPESTALPFTRTETRADCDNFDPLRSPWFGETHVHTGYSFDAAIAGVQTDPRDAYRFALGEPIDLPPYDENGDATRSAQLRRPLDFVALTDHAEYFGEVDICLTEGSPGFDSLECTLMRTAMYALPVPTQAAPPTLVTWGLPLAALGFVDFDFCGPGRVDCLSRASLVWQDTQDAAEEFYDRSSACSFTSFVAYEWTAAPVQNNLHRNVIFRNDQAPTLPISVFEAHFAEALWSQLDDQCLSLDRCDVLAIPHNSNLSGGFMFRPQNSDDATPLTAADAAMRAAMEPLVEIVQHKGESECRIGSLSSDELCGFEKLVRPLIFSVSDPNAFHPPLDFVRNALKEGLAQEEALGVNPFKLGVVGASDSHSSIPGAVREDDYGSTGHIGLGDYDAASILTPFPVGGIEANPGGLGVVWAEENSRDALFEAMRRRETYGTSGTRPVVRFFGGWDYAATLCDDPELVAAGYAGGVPMGGDLPAPATSAAPRFLATALQDPGVPGAPGTPLQRIQIVKGWLDSGGVTHEEVYEVAGDPANGAAVDLASCEPQGAGFASLCSVWEDPDFDPAERAFYYARVVENPSCRWSTYLCNDLGVDCNGSVPAEYATCCSPDVPKTIQERAWTSPIWYQPAP